MFVSAKVDHLGLTPEEQAVRALALAKAAYAGECHCPAVVPEGYAP